MENLTLAGIDGQKSVCLDPGLAPPPGICVVYSFGLSDDWSFESAMALYGCDVYAFDPSLQFPKKILAVTAITTFQIYISFSETQYLASFRLENDYVSIHPQVLATQLPAN